MQDIINTENTQGLSTEEAMKRLASSGKNKLSEKKKKSAMKIFANQFKDFMVMILLFSTVISALLGEFYDAITIIIIVVINAVLGFIQEFRTEHTLEELEKMTTPKARVYRDGKTIIIPSEEIVEGDVIEIEEGDLIPCDGYVITSSNLSCDESLLTGEALSVEKTNRSNETQYENLNLNYMVYMGTICTKGKAKVKCTATGLNTQMGKISDMIKEIPDEQTPLQKKLGELGKVLGIICIGVCVLVFLLGVLRGEPPFEMLMTGITIAIAAIPEGLPATVTISLALAVRQMLKKKALVNKLHSVETLGCANVICTDKTGTLTQNKMTVSKLFLENKAYTFDEISTKINSPIYYNSIPVLSELTNCFLICNSAKLYTPKDEGRNRLSKSTVQAIGDPTEVALLMASKQLGKTPSNTPFLKLEEIPFESATRCMVVTVRISGEEISYIKGSADVILKMCGYILTKNGEVPLGEAMRKKLLSANDEFAKEGLRVLGFCKTQNGKTSFLGLCGMSDPLRPEAKKAIRLCKKAGIKTVMITGDHKLTAEKIARECGIFTDKSLTITGDELSEMTDSQLESVISNVSVFARISPDHKLRIVKAFKKKGCIVAMTGDGVNDAPAIKEADIGVSMGISGTDVSKQAADVILLDDNFSTLTTAVLQGRKLYANIRKFVRYLISCNIGEVITMLLGIVMGLPVVLLPTQILLVNLATDGLPAIALGLEPPDDNIMNKPPRKSTDSFFSDGLMSRIIFRGLLIGLFTILSFVAGLKSTDSLITARTCALFTLVMSQLIHVFECKSEEKSLFSVSYKNNLWLILSVLLSFVLLILAIYTPFLQGVFSTVPLGTKALLSSFLCAGLVPVASAVFHRK